MPHRGQSSGDGSALRGSLCSVKGVSVPPRTAAAAHAVPDKIWNAVRVAILAIHERDAGALRMFQNDPVVSDPEANLLLAASFSFMAFATIGSRIDHRPLTDADAIAVADEVHPLPDGFRQIPYGDVVDTVRSVMHLPTGPAFDLSEKKTVDTAMALTMFIVGLRIKDAAEFEAMRVDVGRWLILKELVPPITSD